MKEKLIINGKGDEIVVLPAEGTRFTNKKISLIDEEKMLEHCSNAVKLSREQEVSQFTGEIILNPTFDDLPAYIVAMCDEHKGSVGTDYESINKVRSIIRENPNFYEINGGDFVDNFNAVHKSALTGSLNEEILSPMAQAKLSGEIFKRMDKQGKLLTVLTGNHEKMSNVTFEYANTWLSDLSCPILKSGGILTIKYGVQEYKIFLGHKYRGLGGQNPSNAFFNVVNDHPEVDVIILGHVHRKFISVFPRGGKMRTGIVGGSFKLDDEYSADMGNPRDENNLGGITFTLNPKEHVIQVFQSAMEAEEAFKTQLEVKKLHARKKN